jgi:hypothetical protein
MHNKFCNFREIDNFCIHLLNSVIYFVKKCQLSLYIKGVLRVYSTELCVLFALFVFFLVIRFFNCFYIRKNSGFIQKFSNSETCGFLYILFNRIILT